MSEIDTISARIAHLGARGDGVTEDGVFVSGALPGERVEGVLEDGRISKPRIMEPSPDRIKPPCRHAKSCGGCSLQHASDKLIADWKAEVVRAALARVNLAPTVRPTETSPPKSRRRAALSARRLKTGATVGFHARNSDTIVDISDCVLLTPNVLDVRQALAEMTKAGGTRKGEITYQITDTTEGVDVSATGGRPMDTQLFQIIAAIAKNAGLARVTWNDEVVVTRARANIKMGPAEVTIPPGAFLQATSAGQAILIETVQDIVGKGKKVVDLFAGAGTFSLPTTTNAAVHAVEGEESLLDALTLGYRNASGLKKLTTEKRDLFRNPLLPEELHKFDVAIIDPPRAGAEAQTREVAASTIPKIAFVSCNPATFARDAKTLTDAGYNLDWVQPVDQFLWSAHVELVASFTRTNSIKAT